MGSPSKVCVAVIDDDESLCRSMVRLLQATALSAITYSSAEAFLADPERPHIDCLLLDIQLGGMSGIELRDRLAVTGSATPVIFLTAYDDPEVREQATAGACAGYFRKMDSGGAIVEAIRDAVG
jgi:FixJ family two-component response regulator